MKLGNIDLSTLGRPFLIAEAGAGHQGSAGRALDMVRVAIASGADAVTFQEIDADRLYTTSPDVPVPHMDRVGWECLAECRSLAKGAGLAFSVCVTDPASLERALTVGIDFIKIVSYDVTFLPFLAACGRTGLPVIMSTGVSLFDEIDEAIRTLEAPNRVVLYHTDCGYPTADADINLLRMVRLRERFGVPVGYCDHTDHALSCLAAAALGAAVIEKHFTLARALGGADHMVSLEPEELSRLFADIKRIAAMRGDGEDRVNESEAHMRSRYRRSLALDRGIRAGDTITEDMLTMLRPSRGIAWEDRSRVVGKTASRDLPVRHLLTPDDVR